MSKRVRIKLNRAAVRALMKSPEMREILAEQAHERMLEEEQLTVGWEQGS